MSNEETKSIFSTKTLIPAGVVGAILVSFVGGIMWVSNVAAQTQQNTMDLSSVKTAQQTQIGQMIDQGNQLTRIETKLDLLMDNRIKLK